MAGKKQTKKASGGIGKWFRRMPSPVSIGGLEISDSGIRYLQFKKGKANRAALRLPPGVVEGGRVRDMERFTKALGQLHERVAPRAHKSVYVVASIPINDVYIQNFDVPQTAESQFAETADLNAQAVSPLAIESAYYDWEEIAGKENKEGQKSLFGVFAPRAVVDEFVEGLSRARFVVAAIEFTSLSIIREIERRKVFENDAPYLVVNVSAEGMMFVIVRYSTPFFHYLHTWREVQGDKKEIEIEDFQEALRSEMNRVLNFYATHWSGQGISNIAVITSAFQEDIERIAEESFRGAELTVFTPEEVSAVAGAAYREAFARSGGVDVSIASVDVLGVFAEERVISFVRIWRNAFLAVLGFLLALFVITSVYLTDAEAERSKDRTLALSAESSGELDALLSEVHKFNALVSKIADIQEKVSPVSALLSAAEEVAGGEITVKRIAFTDFENPVVVGALAADEAAALRFKNRIADHPAFGEVDLPLSTLTAEGGQTSFTVSFKVLGQELLE